MWRHQPPFLKDPRFGNWIKQARKATAKCLKACGKGKWDQQVWKDFKTHFLLKNVLTGRCAYCEEFHSSGHYDHVEHYRPKGEVTQERQPVAAHDGYYWLAYTWQNFLLSCAFCNSRHEDPKSNVKHPGKLCEFPIAKQRLAAPGEEWTTWWRRLEEAADDADALLDLMDMAWRDWWEELKAEEPLLLHPYIDDPQEHFAAKKNGVLLGLTERGRKTIAVCDLNRQCLCDQREAAAEKTLGRRDRYLDRLRLDGRATLEVFTEAEAFSTYCNSRLRKELRAYLKGLETGQIPDWESIDAN